MTLHSHEIEAGAIIEGFKILKVIRTKRQHKRAVMQCTQCLHTFTESTTDLRRYSGYCKYCAPWEVSTSVEEHPYLRKIWSDMLRRNPTKVCPRWHDLQNFANDVGPRPAEPAEHSGKTSAWRLARDNESTVHAPWNDFWWAPGYE